ncbi:MAG: site-specific integrase [Candidatus Scalindua sediminis]|nr:site-specific integrase [Candidatus Scalindua sediminis]
MFKRSGVWWTCIRHNGRKIQKSLETSDRKLAQAIEAKIRTEIVEGTYFEKLVGRNKSFRDMMDKFMKEHAPKKSISMQRSYSASLKHLIPPFGDLNLSSISRKKISRYKVLRTDEGAKPATINRELAMFSKAFNLAVDEWEWLKNKPFSKIPKEKEGNERTRWLTEDEERILLENCPKWLREIVVFALNTGLRQDELLSLEWSRANLFRKTILIQKTKNDKPKTIPLNQIAMDVLEQKSKEKVRILKGDFVFISSHGSKIDRHNLRRAFNNAREKAGIKDFKFHDLRHTFATRLAQKGVDLYMISKLLGHKDIRMTQRYAHHCPESLRVGVRVLESDYNLTTMEKKREFKT